MKIYEKKKVVEKEIIALLERNLDVEKSKEELFKIYHSIKQEYPLINIISIELIETESLRYSVFYQSGPGLSEKAIEISYLDYYAYLWKEDEEWCLDDDLYKPEEIAMELAEAPLFNQIPESVDDLAYLLKNKYWMFDAYLPKFGGLPPDDDREALSWDVKNVLTGTKLENITVISRNEWEKLTNNENHWFE